MSSNNNTLNNRIGVEGVPHFRSTLKRERKEPLVLEASIGDLLDHAMLEAPECYVVLNYLQNSLMELKISDNYGPGFECLDKNDEENPLNMGFISGNHDKDDKESTYGYGTKRALMKLVLKAIIYTKTIYNNKMQFIKVLIDFPVMMSKPANESYNTEKIIITEEEYRSYHPYPMGSTVILSDFVDKLKNIHPEHFKYIVREHYPTRLNKINLFIDNQQTILEPPILSKVNFDNYEEEDGMYKADVTINVMLHKTNKNKFKLCSVLDIEDTKIKTISYDSENPLKRPHWGGSVRKGDKSSEFVDDSNYIKKTLVMSCYFYGECDAIKCLRPARADITDETQEAPSWELQHFSRQLSISHNKRHYNYINTWKIGDNYGLYTVAYLNYSDKTFTSLLDLDSQKNISGSYDQLSQFCKALGGIQEQARKALMVDVTNRKKKIAAKKKADAKAIADAQAKAIAEAKAIADAAAAEAKAAMLTGNDFINLNTLEQAQLQSTLAASAMEHNKSFVSGETKTSDTEKNLNLHIAEAVTSEITTLVLNETTIPSYPRRTLVPLNEPTFMNMLEKMVNSSGFVKLKQNADIDKTVDKTWVSMIQTIKEKIQELESHENELQKEH